MKMTKETRDVIVTELYRKCDIGEISREQREKLIQKANSMFVATENTNVENTDTTKTDTPVISEKKELSPKEKYNIFKEAVYTKYANKEITIETREELLEKAREKFLPVSE